MCLEWLGCNPTAVTKPGHHKKRNEKRSSEKFAPMAPSVVGLGSMAYVFIEVDRSRPPPIYTCRFASSCATCAPDSHHHQLPAVLVRALGSFAASPHAQETSARGVIETHVSKGDTKRVASPHFALSATHRHVAPLIAT